MTMEEMRAVDIRTVESESLVDISKIHIDEKLDGESRKEEFFRQVKNPYCFRVGKIIVKASYSGNGVSLNERFEELVMSA